MSPIYVGTGTEDSEARNLTIGLPLLSTDPINPQAGDYYYNTTDNNARYYDGTQWVRASGVDSLYSFTTYTFNEPDWGRDGTAWSTYQSRYSGEPFLTSGNLVQGQYTGFHKLTLPQTGTYEFEAAGAPGCKTVNNGYYGGKGIILKGRMTMNAGDIIQFAMGKSGESDQNGYNAGGGGGTFIVKDAFFTSSQSDGNIILVAGGGGGGAYNSTYGLDATSSTTGVNGQGGSYYGTGGTNGNGGNGRGYSGSSGAAGPGAGIYTAPSNFTYQGVASAPSAFGQGGQGARGYYVNHGSGSAGHQSGFGGAGAGGNHAGGSGGGYSGGGGGSGNGYSSGGGGSYTANLSSVSTVGWQGNGQVVKPAGGYVKITVV